MLFRSSRAVICYLLKYYADFKAYVGDYKPTIETAGVLKRRRIKFAPWFIIRAEENAMLDEAFGTLEEIEKNALIELYLVRGIDYSTPQEINIQVSNEGWDEVSKMLGKTHKELAEIVNGAFEKLLGYLNG